MFAPSGRKKKKKYLKFLEKVKQINKGCFICIPECACVSVHPHMICMHPYYSIVDAGAAFCRGFFLLFFVFSAFLTSFSCFLQKDPYPPKKHELRQGKHSLLEFSIRHDGACLPRVMIRFFFLPRKSVRLSERHKQSTVTASPALQERRRRAEGECVDACTNCVCKLKHLSGHFSLTPRCRRISRRH